MRLDQYWMKRIYVRDSIFSACKLSKSCEAYKKYVSVYVNYLC